MVRSILLSQACNIQNSFNQAIFHNQFLSSMQISASDQAATHQDISQRLLVRVVKKAGHIDLSFVLSLIFTWKSFKNAIIRRALHLHLPSYGIQRVTHKCR